MLLSLPLSVHSRSPNATPKSAKSPARTINRRIATPKHLWHRLSYAFSTNGVLVRCLAAARCPWANPRAVHFRSPRPAPPSLGHRFPGKPRFCPFSLQSNGRTRPSVPPPSATRKHRNLVFSPRLTAHRLRLSLLPRHLSPHSSRRIPQPRRRHASLPHRAPYRPASPSATHNLGPGAFQCNAAETICRKRCSRLHHSDFHSAEAARILAGKYHVLRRARPSGTSPYDGRSRPNHHARDAWRLSRSHNSASAIHCLHRPDRRPPPHRPVGGADNPLPRNLRCRRSHAASETGRLDSRQRCRRQKPHQGTAAFPLAARQAHISGSVLLHAIINIDGKIKDLQVIGSPDDLLSEAAMNAVRHWTYSPYLVDGKPTEVDTTITVNFNFAGHS